MAGLDERAGSPYRRLGGKPPRAPREGQVAAEPSRFVATAEPTNVRPARSWQAARVLTAMFDEASSAPVPRAPSIRQVAERLGITSSSAYALLNRATEKGWLLWLPDGNRRGAFAPSQELRELVGRQAA